MLDYKTKPCSDDVLVTLIDEQDDGKLENLMNQFGIKYGFTFKSAKTLDAVRHDSKYEVSHLIYRTKGCFNLNKAENISKQVSLAFTSASIIFDYSSNERMIHAAKFIDKLKSKYFDKVNYMRPDDGLKTSLNKILDNAVCDTVRVKYTPVCQDTHVLIPKKILKFFKESSELYEKYKLYHRSPCDGYFAIRSCKGFYITATKTIKDTSLDTKRISYVDKFDHSSNTLYYCGKYLPSSDSVEAAFAFSKLKRINSLIHTHASRLFTRNKRWKSKILVPNMPYGEIELGKNIVNALEDNNTNFIIMAEHGELFTNTTSSATAIDNLKRFLNYEKF